MTETAPTIELVDRALEQLIGLSLADIRRLEPEDFASPRDYRWTGRAIVYTEEGLHRLIEALRIGGQERAAARLERELHARHQPERSYWWQQL